ncbi:hypothetical protein MMOR_20880 [Mycolicibacterium moriokaense]|uniref:Uncharacterized protein n=1 Tax=Mycolicibacterium moriokaense TaxID=39691 RepID=A0AAD1H9H7_9MYCO|nr:hypothetical protein MMOR_20880 [Mycolicibacterium moriokaense]
MDECPREAEMAPTKIGRIVARQRDLIGQPAAALAGGHPFGGLACAAGGVEVGGEPGLLGSCGGLAPFELRDAFDQ